MPRVVLTRKVFKRKYIFAGVEANYFAHSFGTPSNLPETVFPRSGHENRNKVQYLQPRQELQQLENWNHSSDYFSFIWFCFYFSNLFGSSLNCIKRKCFKDVPRPGAKTKPKWSLTDFYISHLNTTRNWKV